jgi:hypothetical protein
VSLGINAYAFSTAQLLSADPRAAALSSLSLRMFYAGLANVSVFGALMVVLTAITPIANRVKEIAGA